MIMLQEHIKRIIGINLSTKTFTGTFTSKSGSTPLDEVVAVTVLSRYDAKVNATAHNAAARLCSLIELTYHDDHFYNFEHACPVTMATNKFIKRIVAPNFDSEEGERCDLASTLHNHTRGINSESLTVPAIVFRA